MTTTDSMENQLLKGQLDLPFGQDEEGDTDATEKKELEDTLEELSLYCSLESKALISTVVIGVDTSRLPVRMMTATASYDHCRGELSICPQETAEFKTLDQFTSNSAKWKKRGVTLAVPAEDRDPLGVRVWLECSGNRVERYSWWGYRAHLRNDLTIQNNGIDPVFRRAYVLALYSGYRLRAPIVCRSIWARLLEVHHLLDDVRCDAHRLAAALDSHPVLDEIPF